LRKRFAPTALNPRQDEASHTQLFRQHEKKDRSVLDVNGVTPTQREDFKP
jgi:hypothetical protein